jgi:hypothetical protein
MPNCTEETDLFGALGRRRIEVGFDGGEVSSDAGLLLLRQVERKLGLLKAAARVLPDRRNPQLVLHTTEQLLRQRVFGLCQGYEDLNDHDRLRLDPTLQTALDKRGTTAAMQNGASSPTLCRFEARANRKAAVELHRVLIEQFIASFAEPPQELILDFDATDDLVHGEQDRRHFSAYYNNYCFLPLYVFCGEQLLVAYLRSAKHDAALHAAAIMKLLTRRLRQAWPQKRLVFRGDSGFCRPRLLGWCERNGVDYIIGLPIADRTSCHLWWPNQFRLLLASLAYVLMERLRNIGLVGTEWARAQMGTLRCKLLKVGAVIVRNTRRIRFFISSAFPYRDTFLLVARRFASG